MGRSDRHNAETIHWRECGCCRTRMGWLWAIFNFLCRRCTVRHNAGAGPGAGCGDGECVLT